MIKAVFLDIDGTLISFETHQIAPSSIEAIQAVREKGVKVFAATGRAKAFLGQIAELPLDGFVIMNGAYCFLPDGTEIHVDAIPQEDLIRLNEYLQTSDIPFTFIEREVMYINRVNPLVEELAAYFNVFVPPVVSPHEAIGKEVLQLMGYFGEEIEAELFGKVLLHCEPMRWHPLFTDIAPKGNDKQFGIARMAAHFGIGQDEILAIGDGGNDKRMLQYAGVGVAMGNAKDDVKACADYVTTSVDQDGVANALNRYILHV